MGESHFFPLLVAMISPFSWCVLLMCMLHCHADSIGADGVESYGPIPCSTIHYQLASENKSKMNVYVVDEENLQKLLDHQEYQYLVDCSCTHALTCNVTCSVNYAEKDYYMAIETDNLFEDAEFTFQYNFDGCLDTVIAFGVIAAIVVVAVAACCCCCCVTCGLVALLVYCIRRSQAPAYVGDIEVQMSTME